MECVNDLAFNLTSYTTAMDLELMKVLSRPQVGQMQITALQYHKLMFETCMLDFTSWQLGCRKVVSLLRSWFTSR